MRRYTTPLPRATAYKPSRFSREMTPELKARIRARFEDVLRNGYWYCRVCDASTDRQESDQGQPPCCSRCGSIRIEWLPPLFRAKAEVAA